MNGRAARIGAVARALAALLLVAGVVACGDDDGPTSTDALDSELVVGKYDYQTLAFDIAGPTFGSYDILQALNLDPDTHFLVIANDGTAQLAFEAPNTGALRIAQATYRMLGDGVRIEFQNAERPAELLIPQVIDLVYDETTDELTFTGDVSVALSRLEALFPELAEEPLGDPGPGTLTVVFEPR